MAAAAAIVMALGVGSLWVAQNNVAVDERIATQTVAIQTFDFEAPEAVSEYVRVDVPDPDPAPITTSTTPRVIAEDTLIATAVPVVVEEESSEALFAGSFESGDLGAWVPST